MSEYVITGLGLTAWAALHSVLATDSVKRLARRLFGRYFLLYRLIYTMLSVGSLAAVWLWLPRPVGVVYIASAPWSWGLRLIQAAATIALFAAFRGFSGREFLGVAQLGRLGADDVRDERLELNTSGLYGAVRHPIYSGSVLVMVASPNMSIWWLMLAIWSVVYFWIGSYLEERRMVEALGEAYREYQRRVPRFIPKLPRLRS